ncbi:MAG TPA: calcium/proton exchanger [Chloroflexota bacterium]|nr:calcium/proton exchanger [Chloroflexota bacterium]
MSEVLRGLSGEHRILLVLLLLVPLTLISAWAGWPSWLQFFLSVGAVIPLAGFIGAATEALADRLGAKIGGLLNATFGNAPDLLVGVFGVQKGLISLVKATLVGALISNSALIMGLCFITAGLRHKRPGFRRDEAGHHSVLMMLTVAAVLFPSLAAFEPCSGHGCRPPAVTLFHISVGVALVLLLAYAAYILYGIFGFEWLGHSQEGRDVKFLAETRGEPPRDVRVWPVWLSVAILGGATVALIPVTDILTGSVVPVTHVLGWTQVFVGIIIVANAGNVAEGYAALRLSATRGARPDERTGSSSGLDLALGIASASSIQIATFVAPVVVLYSLLSHSMSLVFSPVEIGILALLVLIFTYIAHDGESNWLEGVQLVALYVMAAIVFFALPVSALGG